MFNKHQHQHYHTSQPATLPNHPHLFLVYSLKEPPTHTRSTPTLTPKNLIRQPRITIIIPQIKPSLRILILHLEQQILVAGARAHGFQLAWGAVTRKHAAVVVAGVVDEAAGFFEVWPGVAGIVALGHGAWEGEGEGGGEGGEEGWGFHVGWRLGWDVVQF